MTQCQHETIKRLVRGEITCRKCGAVYRIEIGRSGWVPPSDKGE